MFPLKNIKDLQVIAKEYNVEISDSQLSLFQQYLNFLLEWNEKINLISRQNANTETILERHFLDSIIFLSEMNVMMNNKCMVLDIGSGGGFPAIPLAIMKPEWNFTLCESITKKANFLSELVKRLDLKNVNVVNVRVETFRGTSLLANNKYDLITARAVAKLDELIKYSIPLLKKSGVLLAFKGPSYEEELESVKDLINNKKLKIEVFSKEVNGFSKKLVAIQL